jgi:preprotein translocase subunit SecD
LSRGNLFKLLTAVIVILAVGFFSYKPLLQSLDLGLDLQGGVHVVLQAQDFEEKAVTEEDMIQLKSVLEQRVNELGVSEPIIQREGKRRVIVELPGLEDPEEAVNVIGKTASLKFRTEQHGVVLTGKDLENAKATLNDRNEPMVQVKFKKSGAQKFSEITSELAGWGTIAIVLDDKVISNPYVEEAIPSGEAVISGGFEDYDEAVQLAALLRAGALPVDVEIIEKRNVGPQLGIDSVNKSMVAVTIGILAIIVFMILFYRIPGFIASIALIVYGLLVLMVMSSINAVLTLPGIAGLLLSVGMAVDANVIIFERVKEELRNGKSLRAGVDSGFKRAFWTIFDANVTTLLGAAVLYYFGTGLIRGFAVTLSLGILASFFTAIVFSRWLLRLSIRIKGLKNLKLYGI